MYSLANFGTMINDQGRMDAYFNALRNVIDSNSVVLDIGAGTGIFTLLACNFGARKVYAIEPEEIIQVAIDLAAINNFSEKITFIQDLSSRVELPEKATVIVSDLHGTLPLFSHHLPSVIDARKRHLSSGGTLIPEQDKLWAAVAELPELYERYSEPWNGKKYGIAMEPALQKVMNSTWAIKQSDAQAITEPKCWFTLDYYTLESPDASGEISWHIEKAGIAHGIWLWFDSVLSSGISFSNAYDQPKHVFGTLFLPWPEPVFLEVGDTVSILLQANLVGDDYVWRWKSKVFVQDDPNKIKADFKQSSFYSSHFSLSNMRKRAANHIPRLNEDGLIDFHIMNLMDQGVTLENISHKIVEKFPERFRDLYQALAYIGELSIKYSH